MWSKFALVTGCGQGGIGEALVREYSQRGLHAIATVLPSESSEHLSEAGITWFPLDVTKEASILELKKNILALTDGYLDILVNNASVQTMFDVNVFGPMRMVRHFHDMLIESSGTIVNIGSIGGVVPYVYGASYNATKAALQHWSNTLRIISGEVGTNILKRDTDREIPEDSYFAPLAAEFRQHVRRTPDTTDRFVYAHNVVAQSLKPSPPAWFWYGKATFIIRMLDALAFRTIWDGMFWSMFNFDKLKKAHALRRGNTTRRRPTP
ncbi:NAD(P)-binding protein [Durotheca rogersii]|uniref:NAD(P)-binding protein n=1 Tax=Durotheca rogersii TaxID=419775 RepID=UPI00221E7FC5|nr:NAD(P)-binding protein [Durotheca rogersii]KAI5867519.1 NAD(P)-binding protein [Durotheca rogersii]